MVIGQGVDPKNFKYDLFFGGVHKTRKEKDDKLNSFIELQLKSQWQRIEISKRTIIHMTILKTHIDPINGQDFSTHQATSGKKPNSSGSQRFSMTLQICNIQANPSLSATYNHDYIIPFYCMQPKYQQKKLHHPFCEKQ